MLAQIDPLGTEPTGHPQLDPSFFGMGLDELERIPAFFIMDGAAEGETVAAALRRLKATYSGFMGYEFEHMEDPAKVSWLWDQGRERAPQPAALWKGINFGFSSGSHR